MYYNKKYFKEDDLTSLDKMLKIASQNNKKKQDERYYHLYMPKKNGYSVNYNYNRVIPNKKLIPLHMKVGVK